MTSPSQPEMDLCGGEKETEWNENQLLISLNRKNYKMTQGRNIKIFGLVGNLMSSIYQKL